METEGIFSGHMRGMLVLLLIFYAATGDVGAMAGDTVSIQGMARVIHYTKRDFQGDPQFWTMCQDREGVLYFGNNDGALIFDGQVWQKVRLPNNSSIRSLKVSQDGTVYAGGYNELGTIHKDRYGVYHYTSLLGLLRAEDRNIENVWQIHEVQGHMVFRSFRMLIAIANKKALTLPTTTVFDHSTTVGDMLFVKDGEGLKLLDLRSLEFTTLLPLPLGGEDLLTVLPGAAEGEVLALTRRGSFYKVDVRRRSVELWQRLLPERSDNLLTSAILAANGNYYIGTLRTKVIALSPAGEEVEGQAFSHLQDNTVHGLFESNEGNIWVLLNNGIDCIDITSPVSQLFEDASIYDVLVKDGDMFLATNQGVFVSPAMVEGQRLSKQRFSNISGLEGQAWALHHYEGQVLCSHDKGVFVLTRGGYRMIPGTRGVWKVIPVRQKPRHYLVCTYDGIFLMVYDAARGFEIKHRLEGFHESSRDILQSGESGVFWVCHGYKGVFRIRIDETLTRVVSLEHFRDENGLPSPFNVNVFAWQNDVVFTTNHGIFTYHEQENRFKPHAFLTQLFGTELNVRKLLQHGDKTWFAHDNEVGYFVTNEANPKLNKDLFLQLKGTFNPSMECIVPLSNEHVLLGTNTGLYAFDLGFNADQKEMPTLITGVAHRRSGQGAMLPLPLAGAGAQLHHKTSGISFHFAAPAFINKMNVQYSSWLEGVDEGWSAWQEGSHKEYSLLPPGHYVFRVKARSLLGEKALAAEYRFEIVPAWYQRWWALLAYGVLGVVMAITVVRLVKRRIVYEKEKTLKEEHEKRRVLELEIESMKLAVEKERILKDKEQLEEDVIYKSKELVNYTMLLVKKRELLTEMHDDLKVLKEGLRNDVSRQAVRDLIKKINLNLHNEEHLQVFEANFERVHHQFFAQLKSNFQDLTQKELQLCAFVRMNLTNKEIASILNISVRGVETARYRLRKRLGMSHEEDMAQFLEKLHSSQYDDSFGDGVEKVAGYQLPVAGGSV